MPQKTNFNISPYFDDFDVTKNFYKVLFKPGYPVQARELTTIQSILQNQVEQFGSHFFKDGSVVIPGAVSYNNEVIAIRLQNEFNGVDIFSYIPYIVGTTILGKNSGVRAYVAAAIPYGQSEKGSTTLYVNFLDSDYKTSSYTTFLSGEELVVETEISGVPSFSDLNSSILIQFGESFAKVETSDSTYRASIASLKSGVYYIRGTFVNVYEDFLILGQYSDKPSYKVGLRILEDIVNGYEDNSLNDNAQGFSNYSSPGADRFSITTYLDKIPLDENQTEDFIELFRVRDGVLISITNDPQYNIFLDQIARRTYETNGDFYVNPPSIKVRDSLNDLRGNNGIFSKGQVTYNNNVASESLATYQISPLKAYIKGYEVSTISPTFLDFDKTRTTKTLLNQELIYNTGSTFRLNRVTGSPRLGLSTSYTLSLRDSRVGINSLSASGNEIGLSRVYDFALESGSYTTTNPNINEWDISLYDLQLYTNITLNSSLDSNILYNIPCQVKGKSSGAKGYLRYDARNSSGITVYNTKGNFIVGEKLIFNGIENSRVSIAVTQYTLDDVRSLFGQVGLAYTFNADTRQYSSVNVGPVSISQRSVSGISTVTAPNFTFTDKVKVGNIVSYTNAGLSTVTYARVQTVSANSLTIVGVTTVIGICDGALPSSTISPSDFKILSSNLQKSISNTLYTNLPQKSISNVDLTSSTLTIKKEYDVNIISNSTGAIQAGENLTFLPFDEERYVLTTSSGINEALTEDKFAFSSGGETLSINGLSTNNALGCKLIATLRKTNVKSKVKLKNSIGSLVINKSKYVGSGIGETTFNDGLLYGNYPYGTRVQDEDICLLKPEVTNVFAVFESRTTSDPILPNITLGSLNSASGTTGDLIIGEEIVGDQSSAVAICVEKVNSSVINIVYKNSNTFIAGETVTFRESGIIGSISEIGVNDIDITSNFTLEKGQNNTTIDYCKLVRKSKFREPSRKIKIIYEFASFSNSDSGDITTVNSYEQFDYCDLEKVNGIEVSNIIDIRPRVSDYSVAEDARSPFEFLGRSFSEEQNSAKNILASDESFILNYSIYLPRIDKIFLSKDGVFQLIKGEPAEYPRPPLGISDSIELATIYLPPYLCNVSDASLSLTEHKRYTMFDIRKLEKRIENLEYYNSLSLIESGVSSLQIKDSNGLDRTKLGIYVDDFSSSTTQTKITNVKNSFDPRVPELRPTHYSTSVDLLLGYSSIISSQSGLDKTLDLQHSSSFVGTGIKKTGRSLSLDYVEVLEIEQPYSTRIVNVAPFRVAFYSGKIKFVPSSDIWIDSIRMDASLIYVDGNVTRTTVQLSESEFDSQSGFSPVTWGSWSTQWTGEKVDYSSEIIERGGEIYQDISETTTRNGISTRTVSREVTREVIENRSIGDKILSSAVIPYMRSRNIEFTATKLKPLTRLYAFFDGIDMKTYTIPKLLEIQMKSGVFQVGETVNGIISGVSQFSFRVATQNHKYGPYNLPTDIYKLNPYAREQIIPENYSTTSTILNIDTFSLANKVQGGFEGYASTGMILRGQTSGAEATVSDIRLISDNVGTLIGSLFIPDPNGSSSPAFTVGNKLFRLTSSETNSQIEGIVSTAAESSFFAEGSTNTIQENILVIKNIVYETQTKVETKTESSTGPATIVASVLIGNNAPIDISTPTDDPTPPVNPEPDPIQPTPDPGPNPAPIPTVLNINYGKERFGSFANAEIKTLARSFGISERDIKKADTRREKINLIARIEAVSATTPTPVDINYRSVGKSKNNISLQRQTANATSQIARAAGVSVPNRIQAKTETAQIRQTPNNRNNNNNNNRNNNNNNNNRNRNRR